MRAHLYFSSHHSFCKVKRERSENVFGESDFYWPLMVLAEQWQCSLYANVLFVQSSVPTMFLHFFVNGRVTNRWVPPFPMQVDVLGRRPISGLRPEIKKKNRRKIDFGLTGKTPEWAPEWDLGLSTEKGLKAILNPANYLFLKRVACDQSSAHNFGKICLLSPALYQTPPK